MPGKAEAKKATIRRSRMRIVAAAMAQTSLPPSHNAAERARFYTQRVAKDLQAKTKHTSSADRSDAERR
jgi:hypothetical protein